MLLLIVIGPELNALYVLEMLPLTEIFGALYEYPDGFRTAPPVVPSAPYTPRELPAPALSVILPR